MQLTTRSESCVLIRYFTGAFLLKLFFISILVISYSKGIIILYTLCKGSYNIASLKALLPRAGLVIKLLNR